DSLLSAPSSFSTAINGEGMRQTIGRRVCLFAALGAFVTCGCLVFLPRRYPEGNWNPDHPVFTDAWFVTPDGGRVHRWCAEALRPRAVVLYAHGTAGNVTSLHSVLRLFRDGLHASILVFDYRGYGRSEGTPSEEGILADARSARRWLAQRTGVG